jgi:outer membrane protein assembly factor BamB
MKRLIPFVQLIMTVLYGAMWAQTPGNLLWKNSTGWYVHHIVAAVDVNNDNHADMFIGTGNDAVYCYSGKDGTSLWEFSTQGDVWSVASLSDVNGDGIDDCLAGCADNRIYCISGNPGSSEASEIWTYKVKGDVWFVSSIEDVNHDGVKDALAATGDNKVYCLSGTNGQDIWSYTSSSDILYVTFINDVNGDSRQDCLAGGHSDRVYCLSGTNGFVIWQYNMGTSVTRIASIDDVNGDNLPDCLACGLDERVFCLSGKNGTQIWTYLTQAWVNTIVSIADVNGDGRPDCLAGGRDDNVYCLSGTTGNRIWSFTTGSSIRALSSIADVNGTGGQDCIAGGEDNKVYCLEGKSTGNGKLIWSNLIYGTVKTVAPINDISGNAVSDVLAGSDDSYVYAYEGGNAGSPTESVSAPGVPTGPSSGRVGQSVSFTASGAVSSLGHSLEYRYQWGDASYSDWGPAERTYLFTVIGSYTVRVQARCQMHPSVSSDWSSGKVVKISGHQIHVTVVGSGEVVRVPEKSEYNHNEPVTLTAVPSGEYHFGSWGGDLSGASNPVSFNISGDMTLNANFSLILETVSPPDQLSGPVTGAINEPLTFTAGGAATSLDHPVEYRFDWGDGTFSPWGSASQSHQWSTSGNKTVRTQARCTLHPEIESTWSENLIVTIESMEVEALNSADKPSEFQLFQNYPNPYNGLTWIAYHLPEPSDVRIEIYNVHSERIRTLVSAAVAAGAYRISWNGENDFGQSVSSGIYILHMRAGGFQANKTMMYLK